MSVIEDKLGYRYNDVRLLENALTHSSYANENKKNNNERLEFLGDSVLSVIISDYIFKRMKDVDEGDLSKFRATLVCEQSLAEVAKKISLSEFILLGHGEEMTGGRKRPSIISDAFEAVLASIYLDSDLETARKWLLPLMQEQIEEVLAGRKYSDYKTMLQEKMQKGSTGKVTYRTVAELGEDHNKVFMVEVMIDGKVVNKGKGKSKKDAEQQAAQAALSAMAK